MSTHPPPRALAASLLLALALPLAAQSTGATTSPDVPGMVRQLKRAELPREQKEQLVANLLAAGDDGARQLFNEVRLQFRSLRSKYDSARKKHLEAFAKAAPRAVQRKRRGNEKRIDELRDTIRGVTRSPELTKDLIKTTADPALAELEQLLTVTVAEVLESNPKLEAESEAVVELVDELLWLYDVRERAAEALGRSETGRRYLDRYEPPQDPGDDPARLLEARELAALLAIPMTSRDAKVLERNREAASRIEASEAEGILILNRMRLLIGLGALAIDVKLCTAARGHSQDMKRLGFFDHTSPVEGKRSPSARAALAGTSGGAENIARGAKTAAGAIRMWWYSPGHHKNMMGGHGRIGLGREAEFWTQMFG
jgi:hypothetical protein